MEQSFLDEMKKTLMEQRNTILESLASQSEDMKGLIIDLRGNTGGLLTNAVFIAKPLKIRWTNASF